MAPGKKVPCTCTKCRRRVYFEDDEEKQGRLLLAKTVGKHVEADALLAEQAQAELAGSVLLATTAPRLAKHSSIVLPVRRRDSETIASQHETVVREIVHTGRHSYLPRQRWTERRKRR